MRSAGQEKDQERYEHVKKVKDLKVSMYSPVFSGSSNFYRPKTINYMRNQSLSTNNFKTSGPAGGKASQDL